MLGIFSQLIRDDLLTSVVCDDIITKVTLK